MNIFEPQVIKGLFKDYYLLFVFSVLLGAFLVTYYLIPKVLWIVREKKLYKPVVARSVHSNATPTLGGVAFFTAFVLMVSMIQSFHIIPTGNHLIAAVTLMFMVGLKDDLVVSTAKVKLVGQLLAAIFIVFSPEMQIVSLHGFLGIETIPVQIGYFFSAFIIVALINAYNLIDGINGLAGIVGIIICVAYGVSFYFMDAPFFVMISMVVVGILLAYLRYNFSRERKKIFMGDSGSLMIGLILGFLTIKMLSLSPRIPLIEPNLEPSHRLLTVLAILFIPIFDTARVIVIRLWKNGDPFRADANHTHHVLLGLGWNHVQASLALGGLNVMVIIAYGLLSMVMSAGWLTFSLFLIYVAVFALCEGIVKKKTAKEKPAAKVDVQSPPHRQNLGG